MRKDFIELCEYLKNLEIEISYTTNGTCFELIKNPHLITTQEKNYRTFYNAYDGSKHVINTTHKNINDVACAVVRKLCLKQS